MPYPSAPEIATSYTAQEQALGDGTLPGQELDVDLAAVRASITAIIEFLKTSIRSDGRLNNGSVSSDTLASSLIIGFDPPAPWMTAAAYTTRSTVFSGFGFYLCLVAHTSTDFSTDLASGRWVLLADLTPPGGALIAANNLSDLTDISNARTALGLGSMATANAGTGAADFRTNLQNDGRFQQIAATLTSWIAITRASGFDAFVANPTSANLRALLTDETGAGALLFAGGAMGTPSSLVLTNATGLTTAGIAAGSLTTAAETIAANNSDTQVPTSAAAKEYADKVGRVLLASKTASASATLDFTEFDNAVYRRYEFELENVLPATDGAGMRLLTSTNNGASYDTGATDYSHTRVIAASGAVTVVNSAGAAQISVATNIGNAAGEQGVSGIVSVWNAGSAVRTTVQMALHYFDAAAGHISYTDGSGARLASQDTDACRFLMTSGDITSGTIRMYGVRG